MKRSFLEIAANRLQDPADDQGNILDLTGGELYVEPGPAGAQMRVEADYNPKNYEFEESVRLLRRKIQRHRSVDTAGSVGHNRSHSSRRHL